MKKITLALIVFLSLCLGAMGQSSASLSVVNLRCEYLHNPLGIDKLHPRLSWELTSAESNKSQKAYQILVATDAALLDKAADAWDSKRTNSNQTNQIAYSGKALQANTVYYWKVRAWDEKGKPSAWSEVARFSVGPLDAADWKAQWIGEREYPVHPDESYYPFYGFRAVPASQPDAPRWLVIDLGKEQAVDALKIFPAYRREQSFPARFSIEIASTPDFKAAKTLVDESSNDVVIHPAEFYYKKLDEPVTGRYIRLNVHKLVAADNNRYEYSLSEFEVLYNKENLALHQPVTISEAAARPYIWQIKLPTDGALVTDGFVKPNNLYHQYETKIPASPLLRKEIVIGKKIRNAFYTTSAKGIYEAYINGEKVGQQIFAPEFTKYDKHLQYQTCEVTQLLRQGKNALGAMLADGWYAGPRHLTPDRGGYGYFRQFLGQLFIRYEDGTSETIATDNSWKFWAQGPITEVTFFNGEVYDACNEQKNWNQPGFDDTHWSSPSAYPTAQTPLCA
ncbi:MAG: alpha-L-rhamnosidase N-terminal domain-containing protein, partial [Bacteroidales bacterium]|nr:alpha-L-rhamnosidase N-terminal domain-containing protein [Bacteroidales bacterium]